MPIASAALVAIMRGDVGIDLGFSDTVDDDLDFVEEAFREQRADRAVDQAAGQVSSSLGRTALALEEAARDLAGGVALLDVVDGQREEVLAGFGFGQRRRWPARRCRPCRQHGAAGLARDLAGFHADGMLTPLEGLGDFVEQAHGLTPGMMGTRRCRMREPAIQKKHDAIPAGPRGPEPRRTDTASL